MKRFKVVAHYVTSDEFIYRLYERSMFFFWEHVSSFNTIEQINAAVADIYEKEKNQQDIPNDELVGYI